MTWKKFDLFDKPEVSENFEEVQPEVSENFEEVQLVYNSIGEILDTLMKSVKELVNNAYTDLTDRAMLLQTFEAKNLLEQKVIDTLLDVLSKECDAVLAVTPQPFLLLSHKENEELKKIYGKYFIDEKVKEICNTDAPSIMWNSYKEIWELLCTDKE